MAIRGSRRGRYSAEELQLFERYRAERKSGTANIREQKKHAEVMLEIFRPYEWQVYQLRKNGWEINQITAHLSITFTTERSLRRSALEWLRRALVDEAVD
jgi:hypothetical protein